jgi:hypothetical protein
MKKPKRINDLDKTTFDRISLDIWLQLDEVYKDILMVGFEFDKEQTHVPLYAMINMLSALKRKNKVVINHLLECASYRLLHPVTRPGFMLY